MPGTSASQGPGVRQGPWGPLRTRLTAGHAPGQALVQDAEAWLQLDVSVPPQGPQGPTQPLTPAVPQGPPSHPREGPKRDGHSDSGPEPKKRVYCSRWLVLLRGVCGTRVCAQLRAGSRKDPTGGKPPRRPPWEHAGPVRQGSCAKQRLGRPTPPPWPAPLHLPLGPSRAAEPESALTHWQRQCPPSPLPGAFGEAGGDGGGWRGSRDTRHSGVNL